MPVTRGARWAALLVLGAGLGGALPACSVFATRSQSTVAQGRYYASGDPRYDEFFVALFLLQVQMQRAPEVPEIERWNLSHALGATPETPSEQVGPRLHEEALKLSRQGLKLRLDQTPASEKPELASAAFRTNGRPQEDSTAALLSQVERSASALLRSLGEMNQAERALSGLETRASDLAPRVDGDFASAPAGKAREVKKNLSDAARLIALMKARAALVQGESEQLLTTVADAVNTDDGTLGAADRAAACEVTKPNHGAEPQPSSAAAGSAGSTGGGTAGAKRAALRVNPKPKDVPATPTATPAPTPRATPISSAASARPRATVHVAARAADGDADNDDAPMHPVKAEKPPATAPRDFEP